MASNEEVLQAIQDLKFRLFGEEHDPGDIPAIREHLKTLNNNVAKNRARSIRNEVKITITMGAAALLFSGIITAICSLAFGG